jgi:ligand-binding SRPBCC domain-containing protein
LGGNRDEDIGEMKKFQHRFKVAAPIKKVNAFHRSSSSLKAITPPFFFMSNVIAPDQLADGDVMSFTLWLGPFPVRWQARLENINPEGFVDIQFDGPFSSWKHTHRFEAWGTDHTLVMDDVEYSIRRHWFWGPIGLIMAIGLPILFWYRARRTREILEGGNILSSLDS